MPHFPFYLISLDGHLNHIGLAVSTEAPPTNFLFVSWSQSKECWLKGGGVKWVVSNRR